MLSNLRSYVDRAALTTAFKRIFAMGKKVGELINKMDGLVTCRGANEHLQTKIDTLTTHIARQQAMIETQAGQGVLI